jgi:hypothetical protein
MERQPPDIWIDPTAPHDENQADSYGSNRVCNPFTKVEHKVTGFGKDVTWHAGKVHKWWKHEKSKPQLRLK